MVKKRLCYYCDLVRQTKRFFLDDPDLPYVIITDPAWSRITLVTREHRTCHTNSSWMDINTAVQAMKDIAAELYGEHYVIRWPSERHRHFHVSIVPVLVRAED